MKKSPFMPCTSVTNKFHALFSPLPGYFSPFPHGTSSLSVTEEYLGLEGGPPIFEQDFTCPALLKKFVKHYFYGTITLSG